MTNEKKNQLLAVLSTGRYKCIDNDIYAVKSGGLHLLTGTTLPSRYRQHTLYNGVRGGKGIKVTVYQHIICYMATYGTYPDGYVIDHIDGDNTNNRIDNLRAIPHRLNLNPIKTSITKQNNNQQTNPIRAADIALIRQYMAEGYSQSAIARMIGKNRLSVRYTIQNILAGNTLKYE